MRRLVSVLVSIGLIALGVMAYELTRSDRGTYTVTADVEQAPNLFENGRVMVRGVEVGDIVAVEPRPDGVRVSMEIDGDVKIPADATLSVVPITVISDRYVQLFPAYSGGPTLTDGDHLGPDRTTIPAELDDVLTQLKGLLSALERRPNEESGPLTRLIRGLDDALDGREEALAGSLENSAAVLENLADSDERITGLIRNLDRVFIALANRVSEIGLVNERFEVVAESLASDQENLEGTLENVAFLSNEAARLVGESGGELGRSFRRLERVLDTVLKHQDELRRGIRWTNAIAQGLGSTDGSGRGRFAYTGRQAPPGSARASYNFRIDQRDTITCERLRALSKTLDVIFENPTEQDMLDTLNSFLPEEYRDDLEFLLRLLIPLCTDLDEPVP
jgi:phospholipid/cholesterol/gamma-HCH transport system substrate-binding protein